MGEYDVKSWIQKSTEDLTVSKILIDKKILPWIVCFHCQQAIEKYLKALQIVYLKDYQKIHNLVKIFQTLEKVTDIQDIKADLFLISDIYKASRYPSLKGEAMTNETAKEIFQLTKKIIKILQKYLPKA